jgi:hypothetical protein
MGSNCARRRPRLPLLPPPSFLAPPPAFTSPAPAPLSSSVVAVELRATPEGKSKASWRAPPKGTTIHGREEPQTKRVKLPFSAASRRFRSRERDSREEVKRFVGEAVFLTPLAQLCQKQLPKLLLKLCQRDP